MRRMPSLHVNRVLAHHFPNQTIVFISHRIPALKWVDELSF